MVYWWREHQSRRWRPNDISNPSCSLNQIKGFRWIRYVEVLTGYILTGEPWNLAIYDKGAPIPDLLGQWTLGFWKESVFNFWLFLGPLVAGQREKSESLVQVELEVKVLSCAQASAAWLAGLVCYLWEVPWYFIKQDWILLSWFCGYKTRQWMDPGFLSLTEPIKQE